MPILNRKAAFVTKIAGITLKPGENTLSEGQAKVLNADEHFQETVELGHNVFETAPVADDDKKFGKGKGDK